MAFKKSTLIKTKTFKFVRFGRLKKAVAMAYLDEDKFVAMARKAVEQNERPEAVAGPLKVKVYIDD